MSKGSVTMVIDCEEKEKFGHLITILRMGTRRRTFVFVAALQDE
jgi:hypothetical protein